MTTKPNLETDWARAPPPSGPAWRQIAYAFYNPEEKSFLGRTPKRWAIVLVFYSVFYAVLALMFAACMGGLFLTIDYNIPTYTLGKSLIGSNPGVASRPRPTDSSAIVRYDSGNSTGVDAYVQQLNEFIGPYQLSKVVLSEECTSNDNFGYPDTPCFFIKLNKIIGWKPECYNDAENLPAEMPEDLKEYIKTVETTKLNQIWVSCWEEKSNTTKIEYPWGRGLSADFYPYTQKDDEYKSPVVAVKLSAPVNTPVVVRCRVWAKNVVYNKSLKEPCGYTRIQLQIEDNTTTDAPKAEN